MKKLVSLILLFCFFSNFALADCDWSQIKSNSDGTYTYSKELNLCVGKLVQDNKVKDAQIADLNKAITLKDLAIKASDDRAQLWMNTSAQMEDRLQKIDSLEKKNDWLFFGLGILTTSLAVWGAGQLHR